MSGYPSGAAVADYVAVQIVEGIVKDGQHTLADRTNHLLRTYAFATGDNLDGIKVGCYRWWGVLAEALEVGAELLPMSRAARSRIEATTAQAIDRAAQT